MKRIETHSDDVMTYRQPASWAWLFTVPLTVAAIWFAGMIGFGEFGFVPAGFREGGWGLIVAIVFIVIMGSQVLAMASDFVRVGVTLDKAAGTITGEWGFFVLPLVSRCEKIDAYFDLYIHGINRYRSGSYIGSTYYLTVCGPSGSSFRIGQADSKETVLAMAQELAAFADLSIIDGTYEPAQVVREREATLRAIEIVRSLLAK